MRQLSRRLLKMAFRSSRDLALSAPPIAMVSKALAVAQAIILGQAVVVHQALAQPIVDAHPPAQAIITQATIQAIAQPTVADPQPVGARAITGPRIGSATPSMSPSAAQPPSPAPLVRTFASCNCAPTLQTHSQSSHQQFPCCPLPLLYCPQMQPFNSAHHAPTMSPELSFLMLSAQPCTFAILPIFPAIAEMPILSY